MSSPDPYQTDATPAPAEQEAPAPDQLVSVADQRAAGVPPDQTVTKAEQLAGTPPPELPAAEDAPAPDPNATVAVKLGGSPATVGFESNGFYIGRDVPTVVPASLLAVLTSEALNAGVTLEVVS